MRKKLTADDVHEIKYMIEYQVNYYEMVVIDRRIPLSVRDALDCVDFVILHERDHRCYEYWPCLSVLFKGAMDYLKANTSIWEDPIFGQGMNEMKEIKPRYEFKQRILRGHAERLGFVNVLLYQPRFEANSPCLIYDIHGLWCFISHQSFLRLFLIPRFFEHHVRQPH